MTDSSLRRLALLAGAFLVAGPAMAAENDDWTFNGGLMYGAPASEAT